MYALIWRYRIKPDAEELFLEHYGPKGSWARLFGRAPGYLGTELLASGSAEREFATIDRWESEAHVRAFLDEFREEYAALDAVCEALTEAETYLGDFLEVRRSLLPNEV